MPTLQENIEKIDRLYQLQPGWDSYDAEPPNCLAVQLSKFGASVLDGTGYKCSAIVPSVENGIAICFAHGTRTADVEFFNDGDIYAVVSGRGEEPDVWEVEPNECSLRSAFVKIKDFLEGLKP